MKWILKAAIFKTMDLLPFTDRIYHFVQRYLTRSTVLTAEFFEIKLRDCAAHIDYQSRFGARPLEEIRVLELGTGWHPVIPIGLYLSGAEDIVTFDGTLHIEPVMIRETLQIYLDYAASGQLGVILPTWREDRLVRLREVLDAGVEESAFDMLKRFGITLMIGDARTVDLPSASVDFIVSNSTLEHIPADVISAILKEFGRLLAPGGVMSHFIDMSDHFAHVDPSITVYNFLTFSDRAWRLIDNRIVHLNRLRINDQRELLARNGFRVIHEDNSVSQGPEALEKVTLAPRFRAYDRADVMVTHSRMISAPAERTQIP
jgi:SAM-dependent methyltransferase